MESASLPARPRPQPAAEPTPAPVPARGRIGLLEEMGELVVFSGRALKALPGSLRYASEIMRVNAVITRRTTVLMLCLSAFFGATVSNFAFFFLRAIGAGDFAGVLPGLLTCRQLAPQMFGYVIAGSVCTAIAAEFGAARIGEEIDAYEANGVDPMELLVGTRILALLLYVPLAAMIVLLGGYLGSYLTLVIVLGANTGGQLTQTYFSVFPPISMIYCAATLAAVALQCVLVASYYGFRDGGGGPEAVGRAVSRSLGVNLVLLHIIIALAALVFYAGALGTPIGD
jgi:phospholipid/cholesterol/gamma-HCH transport system permease protein